MELWRSISQESASGGRTLPRSGEFAPGLDNLRKSLRVADFDMKKSATSGFVDNPFGAMKSVSMSEIATV